jgi:tetratricopeptide (TPR) repeat protein
MIVTSIKKTFVLLLSIVLLSACGEESSEQSYVEHLERAKVYQEQGQYKAANIEYRNAVRKSNANVAAVVQFADMLITMGQHNVALDLLEQTDAEKDNTYYMTKVRAYQGKQKFLSASKIIDEHLTGSDVETKLLRANNLLGLNELEKARKLYKAILNSDAKNDQAKLGIATTFVRTNNSKDAKSYLNEIAEGEKSYSRARILLAGIAIAEQDLEAAEDILTNLLSVMRNTDIIEPAKAVVLERLSYVLTRQGRSNEAYIYTKLLSEAFPGANEVREKYQIAVQKMQEDNLAESKALLLEILNDYPSYNAATQLLGVISYLEGDNAAASKFLSESVDPEVANDMTRHIYAATNLKMNDPQKVLEILGPGIERSEVPETLALYGIAAISDGQVRKGEKMLLKALSFDENNIRVRMVLADFYRNGPSADKEKEWAQLDAAYKINSTDFQILKGVVSFLLRNEGTEKAKSFISEALRSHAKDYATNLVAGYFYANQNDLKSALKRFTVASEAVDQGDQYLNALSVKGRSEIALKQPKDAKQTFRKAIEAFPQSDIGYKGLLLAYSSEGEEINGRAELERYTQDGKEFAPYRVLVQEAVAKQEIERAKSYLEKAKSVFSDDLRISRLSDGVKYVEALNALRKKDFSVAREKVAEILTNEPDNMRLLSFLVDLELQAGRVKEAEKVLGQIEAINKNHLVVTLLKGDVAIAKEDYAAARGYLEDAWRRVPDNVTANKLYRVLRSLEDRDAQVEFINDWLAKSPNNPQAMMLSAVAFQQEGERAKAIEGYEKVLEITPNNVVALNNLGWIYFEQKDARSLDVLAKAAELAPDNPAVLDSYGWALVDNGKLDKGISYLEKAFKLAPDVKEIEQHLIEAKAKR